jgi:signal transduction histidine kinase
VTAVTAAALVVCATVLIVVLRDNLQYTTRTHLPLGPGPGSPGRQPAEQAHVVDSALGTVTGALLAGVPLLLTLVAGLTWLAVGRALHPVEALRKEVAEITASDLQRRVRVPRTRDEIFKLATTVNTTLNQLERAVARLSTFTSDAAHELRSPLTNLRARLELALTHSAATDWTEVGHESLRDTEQLQSITADLLVLARLDAGRPTGGELVDLAALVHEHGGRHVTGGRLHVDAPAPAVVRGSRNGLSRLLGNLLDNAERYAHAVVRVRVAVERHGIVVEVIDDGPGIVPADRERVFDRFTRLDDSRSRRAGGTGLGLAIARSIATAHGGTLTAEAPLADLGGARFVLRLPTGT